MSLLRGFLRIRTSFPPCRPGEAEWLRADAELTDDISPVFPYLNAIMRGTVYDPKGKTLTFTLGGRGITLYPRRVFVTRIRDGKEAEEVLERLRRLINRTWERRAEIEPSYKTRAKLTALSIYKLPPRPTAGVAARQPVWPSPSSSWGRKLRSGVVFHSGRGTRSRGSASWISSRRRDTKLKNGRW